MPGAGLGTSVAGNRGVGVPPARPAFNRLGTRDLATAFVITALLAVTWAPRLAGPIDLRWDAAAYYVLGTSLYEGNGYRYLNEPGDVAAVAWPPLLAAFVAIHQMVLGTSDVDVVAPVLRISFFVVWALYIALTYVALRLIGARTFVVVGTVLTGLNMLLAAAINSTVVAGENPTVGSTVWLPAESVAPGR